MKRSIFILLLALLTAAPLLAQYSPCYEAAFAEGQRLFKEGQYTEAKKYFNEAKDCPDPNEAEVDGMIRKCDIKLREEKGKKEDEIYNKCNTIADCEYYLKLYPKGRYVTQVQTLKTTLEHESPIPEGALMGLFSVSPTKKVFFSKGNLRYSGLENKWSFHDNQWDFIGTNNLQRHVDKGDYIDLFAWGTSNYNHGAKCYQPWSKLETSTNTEHEAYSVYGLNSANLYDNSRKADWGYNAINNGENQEDVWRTLSKDEWDYLFNKRKTFSGIRFVKAEVNGVNGVILLPDDWNAEFYDLNNINQVDSYEDNIISKRNWMDVFQSNGAAFLPAAGNRFCSKGYNHFINGPGVFCRYWSSSRWSSIAAWALIVNEDNYYSIGWFELGNWCSVRLVCDVAIAERVIRERNNRNNKVNLQMSSSVFSVAPDRKVHFASGNLQYRASTNTWRFAINQWDVVGEDNKNISPSYDGWIDLFGWGTGSDPTKATVDNNDYLVYSEWGNNIGTGWRTMTNEEWWYVFNHRETTSGIRYAMATVNEKVGVIILPDDWSKDYFHLNKVNVDSAYETNIISSSQWSVLEQHGAVFLPAAGGRKGNTKLLEILYWLYWTSTLDESCEVQFSPLTNLAVCGTKYRYIGHSVRLVYPVKQ